MGVPVIRMKVRILTILKATLFGVVAFCLWQSLSNALGDFEKRSFPLHRLKCWWLAGAGLVYILGLLPMAWFWHRLLVRFGMSPPAAVTLSAYYSGHLGKYVPGKAAVIALRMGLIRSWIVNPGLVAISVFVETLTMMFVGALIALLMLATQFTDKVMLQALSFLLMIAAGLPTLPPVLNRLIGFFKGEHAANKLSQLEIRFLAGGWLAITAGWLMMGISFLLTLRGMSVPCSWSDLPRLVAAVCLAVVAGFLSLLPGGVGVREFVLNELMVSPYGEVVAILSAILLRVVWLLSEVLVSGILYLNALRFADASKIAPHHGE